MTARACPHGMPTPAACWECMEDGNLDPPPPPPPLDIDRELTARFDGHCHGCNLGVHPGQRIVRLTDNTYRHTGCWP